MSLAACFEEYALEYVAYAMTALPQLLHGLTPAAAAANRGRYGYLTHEFDATATHRMLATTLRILAAWRARGWL